MIIKKIAIVGIHVRCFFKFCCFRTKSLFILRRKIEFDIFHRGSICWYWIKVDERKCCRGSLFCCSLVNYEIILCYRCCRCFCIPIITSHFFLVANTFCTLWKGKNESSLYSREGEIMVLLIFHSHHILEISSI